MLLHQYGLTTGARHLPGLTSKRQATNSFLILCAALIHFPCEFRNIIDGIPLVQEIVKKLDLDDMMNEVQEDIEENDAEFAVL